MKKLKILFLLNVSVFLVSCTTTRIRKDDHSYTYIFQNNDNPENITMNNRIKKPTFDSYSVPMKSNVKNYGEFDPSMHPMNRVSEYEESNAAPTSYTPETNGMIARKFAYFDEINNRKRRTLAHNYSSYPYYIPNNITE